MDYKLVINLFLFAAFLYASLGAIASYALEKKSWLFFSKPFIIPLLLLYYVFNAQHLNTILLVALIFAFLGDFFLMWPDKKNHFLLGLLSFFIMQVLFVVFIWNNQITIAIFSAPTLIMNGVYLVFGIIIFSLLYRYLKDLVIPVIFYILLLLSVSYFCFLNVMEHKTEIAFVQYIGSLLFLISDTILAFDSFKKPIRYGGIFIMITYILAQIFLLAGFMNT